MLLRAAKLLTLGVMARLEIHGTTKLWRVTEMVSLPDTKLQIYLCSPDGDASAQFLFPDDLVEISLT
jgi:hypothetical protein